MDRDEGFVGAFDRCLFLIRAYSSDSWSSSSPALFSCLSCISWFKLFAHCRVFRGLGFETMTIADLLHQRDGQYTREMLLAPGGFGLGFVHRSAGQ